MIERFNFFDVYGYFLPGLALIALVWLPFGIFQNRWPPRDLTSAAAALAFAYIIGHFLQTIAVRVIPSQIKVGDSLRYPSDRFLDAEDKTFSAQFKAEVITAVKRLFEIELGPQAANPGNRQEAFFLCRALLVEREIAGYAEQFQGMYSLMRGLTAAFGAGSFYMLGWTLSFLSCEPIVQSWIPIASICTMSVIALTIAGVVKSWNANSPLPWERYIWIPLLVGLCAVGAILGRGSVQSSRALLSSLLLTGIALFATLRFFGACRFFAQEFAKAVWRDFLAHAKTAS